jgi:8-amino-7-oxononanoate synthase
MDPEHNDAISRRIQAMEERYLELKKSDYYFYDQPVSELQGGSRVIVNGRQMGMFASYSYLGLIGHPRINAAAQKAIDTYGTGTHGVRLLAGTLAIHRELEETIARFKHTQAAVTFSSGYMTNLTALSTLLARGDHVFSDKLNHASIVDGCLMARAEFHRFEHNNLPDLEKHLKRAPAGAAKLVVVDAVFSMDGDVTDLPGVVELCRRYQAWLMVDEAHSVGVLGASGRGIEEHFGLEDVIDIKMGTLSKTIPASGGYIAGRRELVDYLRHAGRGYIFSAALTPAQAGAASEAFKVIQEEPWRIEKLRANASRFTAGLKAHGFDTLHTQTAIVPILCGSDEQAYALTREAQRHDLFVLPVVSPAVPQGMARLRTTVTAAHEPAEIDACIETLAQAGKRLGMLPA